MGRRIAVLSVAAAGVMMALPGVAPADELTVKVTPTPPSVPEPGGTVDYRLEVTAAAGQSSFVQSLVDDKYGDLDGRGTCVGGATPIDCHYAGAVRGFPGDSQRNTVTATGSHPPEQFLCELGIGGLFIPCPSIGDQGSGTATVVVSKLTTGQRAEALKRCKMKRTKKARKRCRRKANRLPV
jgi:hypothetical protein